MPNISVPTVSPKGDYGPILLEPVLDLFEPKSRELFGYPVISTAKPPSFEEIGLPHWLVLYETNIPSISKDPMILYALTKDRALVYVDDEFIGTLSRTKNINSLPLTTPYGQRMKILVENQGHLNYGNEIHDFKVFNNFIWISENRVNVIIIFIIHRVSLMLTSTKFHYRHGT